MKRKILIASVALCLVALMACMSLAYFTASKSVENKFMVASTDPDNPPEKPDDIFSITVTETNVGGEGTTDKGNTYKDITPGDSLKKDPTVTNTGAYDAYVRVKVTFTKADEWKTILAGKDYTCLLGLLKNVSKDFTLDEKAIAYNKDADTVTFTYFYNNALAPKGTAMLFDTVEIPTTITTEQFLTISSFNINVSADAIQAANTGKTAAEAFVLFDAQESAK